MGRKEGGGRGILPREGWLRGCCRRTEYQLGSERTRRKERKERKAVGEGECVLPQDGVLRGCRRRTKYQLGKEGIRRKERREARMRVGVSCRENKG